MRKIILISLLVSQIVLNCDDRQYDVYSPTLPALVFSDDTEYSLVFDYSSHTSFIPFTANYTWVAEVDEFSASWLHISPLGGEPGKDTITFRVDASSSRRNGTITIYAGDTSVVFKVSQFRDLSFAPLYNNLENFSVPSLLCCSGDFLDVVLRI